jgi:hypothetical protein
MLKLKPVMAYCAPKKRIEIAAMAVETKKLHQGNVEPAR